MPGTLRSGWVHASRRVPVRRQRQPRRRHGVDDGQRRLRPRRPDHHQGSVTYTHDDNGSRVTRVDGTGTTTYTYDLFSRLHAVTMPGPVSIEYVIDGLGRRVAKSKNGALERSWVYLDGLRIGAETDHTQAPTVTSRFVYGSREHVPDYMEKGGDVYRLVTDQLGSVRLVVDVATGSVAQRIDYDAWGNPTLVTDPSFQIRCRRSPSGSGHVRATALRVVTSRCALWGRLIEG